MTDRLREKLSSVATITGDLTRTVEAKADALIARKASLEAKADKAFAAHESVMSITEQGLDEVEGALRLLSNANPTTGSTDSSST
jgi:hypothetical protein